MVLVIRPVTNGGMMVPKKPLSKLPLGYNATKNIRKEEYNFLVIYLEQKVQWFKP